MPLLQHSAGRWHITVPMDTVIHNGWTKRKKFHFTQGEKGQLIYTPMKEPAKTDPNDDKRN